MKQIYNLRRAVLGDEGLLLSWANDLEVRRQAINQKRISIADHKKWFRQKLRDPLVSIFILEMNYISVGQFRYELVGKEAILDYSLASEHRGQGLGAVLLAKGINIIECSHPQVSINAEIKERNDASKSALLKVGFKKVGSGSGAGLSLFRLDRNPHSERGIDS